MRAICLLGLLLLSEVTKLTKFIRTKRRVKDY